MPVDLLCERCERLIGKFPYDKVRDFVQANGEVCKSCSKREEKLIKFFEREKNVYIKQLEKILEDAKQLLAEKIRELAIQPLEGKDGGDNDSSGSA